MLNKSTGLPEKFQVAAEKIDEKERDATVDAFFDKIGAKLETNGNKAYYMPFDRYDNNAKL